MVSGGVRPFVLVLIVVVLVAGAISLSIMFGGTLMATRTLQTLTTKEITPTTPTMVTTRTTTHTLIKTYTVTCNNHVITRGNFDLDPEDEVMVDGMLYDNGDTLTIDGKTYKVIIESGDINGAFGNDFIVGGKDSDTIYGKVGDDFIIGFSGEDFLVGDGLEGITANDVIKGGDDIICGNDDFDNIYGDFINGGDGNDNITGGNDIIDARDGNPYDTVHGDYIGNAGTVKQGNNIIMADPDHIVYGH